MAGPAAINDAVKDYCTSPAADDWDFRAAAEDLHAWAARMNDEFGLGLATPVIVIGRLRGRAPAYREGRNGLGLLHQIQVDSRRLAGPWAVLLAELFRELLRERHDLGGHPSRGRYYSAALRKEARSYGLWLGRKGRIERVEPGAFTELLARHGVATAVLGGPLPEREHGASRMKKWACACTIVRAATEVEAVCNKCGEVFRRPEGG